LLFDWVVLIEMINTNADSSLWRQTILPIIQRWVVIILAALPLIQTLPAADNDPPAAPSLKDGTPATYTSLKRFPQNLGGNFLALFSNKNIVPLLIGGAASGIVAPFDRDIRNQAGMHGQSSAVGSFGSVLGGGAVVGPAVAGLLIGSHYSKDDRFHSFAYSLAQGTVIDQGLIQGLHLAVTRNRPDGEGHSFPSGHASTSFMIATVAAHYYGKKAGIIGYSTATFIAFARARQNKHWASDLTAGATLGYIVGSSVSRRTGISMKVGKIVLLPALDLADRRIRISLITEHE
jgi:membrane-associated phospholipid phosphatase